jgi:hypothetical protein
MDATARDRTPGVAMEIECIPRNIASPMINIAKTVSFGLSYPASELSSQRGGLGNTAGIAAVSLDVPYRLFSLAGDSHV